MAAARALAELAREDVPDAVSRAYGGERFTFGPDYIIPKPFDPRVLMWVAPAVAKAAMDTGVARLPVDLPAYRERLLRMQSRVEPGDAHRVRQGPRRDEEASRSTTVSTRGCCRPRASCWKRTCATPVLLGRRAAIEKAIVEHELEDELKGVTIVDPEGHPDLERFTDGVLAPAQAARHQPGQGAGAHAPPRLLRRDAGGEGRGRRLRHRPHPVATPRRCGRRCEVIRTRPGPPRGRRVHRGAAQRLQVLRGLHREPRALARGAGGPRHRHRRPRAVLRRHAAHRVPELLQLRHARTAAPRPSACAARWSWRRPRARARDGRRDAGRHRAGGRGAHAAVTPSPS